MAQFDPYHKWLGIPPQEQPPHHYRLLGLTLFESDPDVIDMAADRQMTYLKQCAAGPHVQFSQRLLSEVASARLCLLKTESKARYDATLKSSLPVEAKAPAKVAEPPSEPQRRKAPEVRKTSTKPPVEPSTPSAANDHRRPGVFPELGGTASATGTAEPRPPHRHWSKNRQLQIGAGLAAVMILVAGSLFRLKSADGTLIVDIDEPDSDVQLINADGKVEAQQHGNAAGGSRGAIALSVLPGRHELHVSKEGFEPFTRKFTMKSGEKQTIRASLKPVESDPTVEVDEAPLELGKAPTSQELKRPADVATKSDATKSDATMSGATTSGATGPSAEGPSAAGPVASKSQGGSVQRWTPTPEFETWMVATSTLPPEEQLAAVTKKLQELNPGFNGKLTPTMDQGQVSGVQFETDRVGDLSPVRALPALKSLKAAASNQGRGKVSDLSPLAGLPLTSLSCKGNDVVDITPLRGMPLTFLSLSETQVADITPLQGMPITFLELNGTQVTSFEPLRDLPLNFLVFERTRISDLSPLQDKKLTFMAFNKTDVTDLSPLKDMPLTTLMLDVNPARDGAILRSIKTLATINFKPVAEFWKENGGT